MKADRRLEILDGVEVAVLAQQSAPERRYDRVGRAAPCEIAGDQRSCLVHLLLTVQQRGQRLQQLVRVGSPRVIRGRNLRRGHVEEAI